MVLCIILRLPVLGFDICATGANTKAAAFAGVPITRTALLSGALAGLAGAVEVAGRTSVAASLISMLIAVMLTRHRVKWLGKQAI